MHIVLVIFVLTGAAVVWFLTLGPYRAVPDDAVAPPPKHGALGGVKALEGWNARRVDIRARLAAHVYGPELAPVLPTVVRRERIPPERAGGVAGVEQWLVSLGVAGRFNIVLVLPRGVTRPPTIVMQNFCGNQAAFPGRPEAIAPPLGWYPWICKEPALDPLLRVLFGPCLNGPPYELLAERGYAAALVYAGDIVPDRFPDAGLAMRRFAREGAGSLGAWAWLHSRTLDVLAGDERLDPQRFVVWGQSRNGKTALLAGARDERFAAVVGLQSGRGGDALTQHRQGESVRALLMQFPHWMTPDFARYKRHDPPVDQHELLALIAPRPLLTGHARRDGWADPAGGRAALAAVGEVYDLHRAPRPAIFTRSGHHGIEREDWERTLDFLDERLKR